jgi:membrane protein YdbS with pleckstrin-like domain
MQTLYRAHPNWRSFYFLGLVFKALIAIVMIGAIGIGLSLAGMIATGIGFAIAGAGLVVSVFLVWLARHSRVYTVTTQAVRLDHGIINRRREEFSVRKVQSIDVRQNILERFIFRTGTLAFDSASYDSAGPSEIIFKGISRPHQIADLVRNADSGNYGSASDAYQQIRSNSALQPRDDMGDRPSAPGYQNNPNLPPR